ncbi:MAG: signal peptide peptidase SppA [Candidatus Tectomicrobia bacterium]|nr:signal peptide peptidase SppA [Candidatus Tectomicrobia bacterium]
MRQHPILTGFAALGVFFTLFLILGVILSLLEAEDRLSGGEKIAVVHIEGVITDSDDIVDQLRRYAEASSVKGIVLRIDSPGGAVAPSQEIYAEVERIRGRKKAIVTSMGNVAASGGYYIASASERIWANPGTLTGSIGVIMELPNIEGLMEKVGLKAEVIKSGEYKDVGIPTRKITEPEKLLLQKVLDDVHQQFIEAVSRGRRIDLESVKQFADGRIFSGKQAKEVGLVDQLGGLQEAIAETAKLAGISGKPRIIQQRDRGLLYRLLKGSFLGKLFLQGMRENQPRVSYLWHY